MKTTTTLVLKNYSLDKKYSEQNRYKEKDKRKDKQKHKQYITFHINLRELSRWR